MSYEIVRKIKVRDNKVFLNSDSNNVYPKYFHEQECLSLTKILKEKGREALDIAILKAYEEGNFQTRGYNRYTRALQVLRHMPGYKEFDWRASSYNNDCPIQKNRKNEKVFNDFLRRSFYTRLPKDKFIISKEYAGNGGMYTAYLWKQTKRFVSWCREKERAKIFRYEDDAIWLKKCFHGSETWEVEKIK